MNFWAEAVEREPMAVMMCRTSEALRLRARGGEELAWLS